MKTKIVYAAIITTMIFLASINSAIATTQVSKTISTSGNIVYWPQIEVSVNPDQIIGINNLLIGYMLDSEWKSWLDRSSWREMTSDADFKIVRIFDFRKTTPRLSPCTYWNETSLSGTWDWTYVDLTVQRLFETGAEPLFALGWARDNIQNYIPTGMAVNPSTSLPYPESWAAYCKEWPKHFLVTGLPVRFYETMNEPWTYFEWNNYEKLGNFMAVFNAAAEAMRNEDPNVMVSFDGTNRKPVLDYWLTNGGTDLGFISFHKYDAGEIGQYSDEQMLNRAESFQLKTSASYYGIQDVRNIYFQSRNQWIPVINSESNLNSAYATGTDPRIQQMMGAVWLALVLRTGILEGLDYNIYFHCGSSESWEMANKPSGGVGYGMINMDNNKPWYPYYTQYIIGNNLAKGDSLLESSSSSQDIKVISWLNEGQTKLLVISKVDQPLLVRFNGIEKLAFSKIDSGISWQNAAVQYGEVNASSPLMLSGYAVAVLSVLE